MRHDLTADGIHPLRAGYVLMAPVAEAAIRRALGEKTRTRLPS
ncbi:hypothetical protein ACYZX9_06700 [Sphingomonas citri]